MYNSRLLAVSEGYAIEHVYNRRLLAVCGKLCASEFRQHEEAKASTCHEDYFMLSTCTS